MRSDELSLSAQWRKSSRSNNGAANCVECAPLSGTGFGVRDSKEIGGTALVLSDGQWSAFLRELKNGSFDL